MGKRPAHSGPCFKVVRTGLVTSGGPSPSERLVGSGQGGRECPSLAWARGWGRRSMGQVTGRAELWSWHWQPEGICIR